MVLFRKLIHYRISLPYDAAVVMMVGVTEAYCIVLKSTSCGAAELMYLLSRSCPLLPHRALWLARVALGMSLLWNALLEPTTRRGQTPYSGPRSPVFGTEPQRHRVAAGFRSKGDTRSRRRAYAVHTVSRGENAK